MQRKPAARHVRPIEAAAFQRDGEWVDLNPNEIYDADHPVVKERPELFRELEADRQRPAVEQATANPGEPRKVTP